LCFTANLSRPCISPAHPRIERNTVVNGKRNRWIQRQCVARINRQAAVFAWQIEAIIPRKNENDGIDCFSLQYISGDGTKKFLSGSRVKGHFFLIGNDRSGPLYVAEGFATAASIHEATGVQAAVAFNAGNLAAVTESLHHQWPKREIVLCADDDASGLAQARVAAQAAGGKIAVPDFGEDRPKGAKDFNDLAISQGPEAVADSIRNAKGAFHALENLVERSIADPSYAFRPDVVAQLKELKKHNGSEYETLRAGLKRKTKCRVTHLDRVIDKGPENNGGNGKTNMADRLIAFAYESLGEWSNLFISTQDDGFNEAFADLTINGHRETWPVASNSFTQWMTARFFDKTGDTPGSEALRSAVNLIQAKAFAINRKRPVFVRSGASGGKLYLDLCDAAWRSVAISGEGWRVVDSGALDSIRFHRYFAMKPLPEPQPNGAIDALREFINIRSDDDFVMLVSWLLAALRNTGPYPLLVISGEQGSAKSTVVRIIRSLIDPSHVPMRLFPRKDIDLFISARHNHLLAFDNLSYLSNSISDTLCQLATGGGLGTRRLYSDEDELLISTSCPIVLNGIENVAVRPDLADRSVFITLEPIPEQDRRLESELWASFETQRPRILGALLDAMVVGLERSPNVQLPVIPRMADFAKWAVACEIAFWSSGTFLSIYRENRQAAMEETVKNDPVADSIYTLAQASSPWDGTSSELLLALGEIAGERTVKSQRWPGNANVLSKYLRRIMPPLRSVGIEVLFQRKGHSRSRNIQIKAHNCRRPA